MSFNEAMWKCAIRQQNKAFRTNVISMKGLIFMLRDYNDYMAPQEVADEFGVSLTTVYNLLRSGKLPGFKIGKKWFVSRGKMEIMVY